MIDQVMKRKKKNKSNIGDWKRYWCNFDENLYKLYKKWKKTRK